MNCYSSYIICGIDRLGKDTLIKKMLDKLGFYQVINFGKPEKLSKYGQDEYTFQRESFENSMVLLKSDAKLIYNRSWIGEAVYAGPYRGYEGNYVFELEKQFGMDKCSHVKLILLVEDFTKSQHFVSDGQSFDDNSRELEQALFYDAFFKSILPNKKIVCVTDQDGKFRNSEDILNEVLQ